MYFTCNELFNNNLCKPFTVDLVPYLKQVLISKPVFEQSGQWNPFHGHHSVHTHLSAAAMWPRFAVTCELAFFQLFEGDQITDLPLQSMEVVAVFD